MMNWLRKRLLRGMVTEVGTGANPNNWIAAMLGGNKSSAGISLNEDKALTVATVYAGVDVIAKTIAALPLHVYRRADAGRELASRHWAYPLLHDSPNEYHSAFIWRHVAMTHALLWGNAYSRIDWLGNGQATALYPLEPWNVEPKLTSKGVKYYRVRLKDGWEDLPDDEVLHVPAMSYDGIVGLSPIGKLRDSLGLAKAAENFGADFFANDARPGVILETPGRMKEAAQKNLAASLAEKFAGSGNRFGVLVLEEGAKMHTVQIPPQDAQFLETRKFQRTEICGWFGVPPVFVGDYERANFANSEQQDLTFAKHTITPWCVRLEQELNRKLFVPGSGLYAKFSLEGLLRGDFKTRMEGLMQAVGGPFLTRNEARELEDWNSMDGLGEVLTPLNMGVGANPEPPEPKDTQPQDTEDMPARAQIVTNVVLPEKLSHEVAHTHRMPEIASAVERGNQAVERSARAMETAAKAMQADAEASRKASDEALQKVVSEFREAMESLPAPVIQNEVRVEPAPVNVNVNLPDRRTVSTIERDRDGNIAKVTQLETDA